MKRTWITCLFFVLMWTLTAPPAHATLKSKPHQSENLSKLKRLERWAFKKSEKQIKWVEKWVEKRSKKPTDPPDDDEPAEAFPLENPKQRAYNGGKRSKLAFWLIILSPILLLFSIFTFIFDDNENLLIVVTLGSLGMFVYGIIMLFQSFRYEGANFYNVSALVLLLLVLASLLTAG